MGDHDPTLATIGRVLRRRGWFYNNDEFGDWIGTLQGPITEVPAEISAVRAALVAAEIDS